MEKVSIRVDMTVPDNFDAKLFCLRASGGDYPELAEEFCRSVANEFGLDKEDIEDDFQIEFSTYND